MSDTTTVSDVVSTAPKRTRNVYKFTDSQLIECWETSESTVEAAEKLSKITGNPVPKNIVASRVGNLRKQQVNLKTMPKRINRKRDVEALNAQIKELRDQTE